MGRAAYPTGTAGECQSGWAALVFGRHLSRATALGFLARAWCGDGRGNGPTSTFQVLVVRAPAAARFGRFVRFAARSASRCFAFFAFFACFSCVFRGASCVALRVMPPRGVPSRLRWRLMPPCASLVHPDPQLPRELAAADAGCPGCDVGCDGATGAASHAPQTRAFLMARPVREPSRSRCRADVRAVRVGCLACCKRAIAFASSRCSCCTLPAPIPWSRSCRTPAVDAADAADAAGVGASPGGSGQMGQARSASARSASISASRSMDEPPADPPSTCEAKRRGDSVGASLIASHPVASHQAQPSAQLSPAPSPARRPSAQPSAHISGPRAQVLSPVK